MISRPARIGHYAKRGLWALLLAWGAVLLVILIPTVREADNKFEQLRSTGSDNAYWTVSQLEVDVHRLALAIATARSDPTDSSLDEIRKRFDILYSRDQVTSRGVIGRAMSRLEDETGQRRSVTLFLEDTLAIIDADDETLRQALPEIEARLRDVSQETRRFVIAVTHFFNAETDQLRLELALLRNRTTQVGYLLIGLLTLMLLILAVQHKQQVQTGAQLTEAKRKWEASAREASKARSQLSAAMEALPDGFAVYDADERVVLTNAKYRQLYPRIADAIKPGVTFSELIRLAAYRGQIPEAVGREKDWIRERLQQFQSAQGMHEQLTAEAKLLRYYDQPTEDGGRVCLRMDVTELHRARQDAEAASHAKTAFLANMSHEIRTPMNGVLGMIDLLSETPLEPAQQHMLTTIRASGDALIQIINDTLDLARIEAGKIAIEPRPFVAAELVERICALHRVTAERKGIRLDLFLELAPEEAFLGDATRVAQILNNIIGNAVKFTEFGRVDVRLAQDAQDRLVFHVRDTGIGMTDEQVARIFDEFEQADMTITRRFGGSGLGMAIVDRLVGMMDGQINVRSALGVGTEIDIALPLTRTDAPEAESRAKRQDQVLTRSDLRILAAEDNSTNTLVLKQMLKTLGITAHFVTDGEAAIAAFTTAEYDVLLLDIRMPRMGGIQALEEIRKHCARFDRKMPPSLAATANVMETQVAEYLAAGFTDVLSKPYKRIDLVSKLNALTAEIATRDANHPAVLNS